MFAAAVLVDAVDENAATKLRKRIRHDDDDDVDDVLLLLLMLHYLFIYLKKKPPRVCGGY